MSWYHAWQQSDAMSDAQASLGLPLLASCTAVQPLDVAIAAATTLLLSRSRWPFLSPALMMCHRDHTCVLV